MSSKSSAGEGTWDDWRETLGGGEINTRSRCLQVLSCENLLFLHPYVFYLTAG